VIGIFRASSDAARIFIQVKRPGSGLVILHSDHASDTGVMPLAAETGVYRQWLAYAVADFLEQGNERPRRGGVLKNPIVASQYQTLPPAGETIIPISLYEETE
jgi:hypothetical protein